MFLIQRMISPILASGETSVLTSVSWRQAVHFSRLLALVLVAVMCLAGGDCGGSPPPPPADPVIGDNTDTTPPPSAQTTLINLINTQVRSGLTALVTGSTNVAQTHTDYMYTTGILTEIMNGQTFTTRLIAAGVTAPVTSEDVIAYGYSDPQALVNAILADSNLVNALQGNFTTIEVGLAGQGNGNYWTILVY